MKFHILAFKIRRFLQSELYIYDSFMNIIRCSLKKVFCCRRNEILILKEELIVQI